MILRFKEKEDLIEAMPEILRETTPCLKFISEEEIELPIYVPMTTYIDMESNALPMGTMDIKLIPLHYKPMISTGDWVPTLQIKIIVSNMKFKNEDFKELFKVFAPVASKNMKFTHFLVPITTKINDYFRYCNMRKFSYNIYEIEWKD
jgi:hypothetical protein